MTVLAHSFSESTALSGIIDSTYTTVHTHASSNFTAGNVYLLRVKAKLFGETTTNRVMIKVRHGTTDFAESEHIAIPATVVAGDNDFPTPYCWFEKWTAVSGEDITVQIRTSLAGDGSQSDQIEFLAIDLTSLTEGVDYWYADVPTDTALSIAGINGASISLTPPAGTDLWVMSFGRIDIGSITTSAGSRIVSTGTFAESLPSSAKEGDDATNEIWVCDHERVFINLANSAQTFTEQSYVEAGPTGNVLHSRIFALRLNIFRNRAVAYTEAAEVLGTTAWADPFQVGVNFTPDVAGDALISVSGNFDSGNALREVLHRLQIDNVDEPPTQTTDTYDEAWALDADNEIIFGTQTVENLTAASHTIDWEGHSNSTTGAPQVKSRSLVAFSFELAPVAVVVAVTPPHPLTYPRFAGAGMMLLRAFPMFRPQPAFYPTTLSAMPDPVVAIFTATDPTVVAGAVTLAPDPVVAAFSVVAPTVVAGAVTLTPSPVAAAFTATDPVVTNGFTLTPDAVVASFTTTTPTIVAGAVMLTPSPVAASFTTTTPTIVAGGVTMTPDPVIATFTTTTPTLVAGAVTLTPSPVAASFTTTTPTLVAGAVTLTPDPVAAAFTVTTPTLIPGAVTLTPAAVVATFTTTDPTILTGGTVAPDPVVAAFTTTTPTLVAGAVTLTPDAVVATFTVPAPTVLIGAITLTPSPVAATFSVVAPTVVVGAVILTPDPATATFTAPAPTLVAGPTSVSPSPAVAIFSVPSPSVFTAGVIADSRMQATGPSEARQATGGAERRDATGGSQKRTSN